MKRFPNPLNERVACAAARIMKYLCYFLMLFFLAGMTLSILGRQTFVLHTPTKTYDRAIYAEESHEWSMRGLSVGLNDEVQVFTQDGSVDIITQIALSTMYAISCLPLLIAYWFLSRVFDNVSQHRIFTEENASYLFRFAVIQIAAAIGAPLLNMIVVYIANQWSANDIAMASGRGLLSTLFPSIAFIVAAYIIRYGVQLQDEADHTL